MRLARQLVRNDEISTSFHLIRQAVGELDSIGDLGASVVGVPARGCDRGEPRLGGGAPG